MTITDERTATIGSRMRAARLFAGLEQSELAADLGVSRTSIHNWENDKASLPAAAMIRYAELCRISLDWLAFGKGVRPEGFEPPTY